MYGRTILLMASLALPLIAAPLSGNTHSPSADVINEGAIPAMLGDRIKRDPLVEALPLESRLSEVAGSKRDTSLDQNANSGEDNNTHETDDVDNLGNVNNIEVRSEPTDSLEDRKLAGESRQKSRRAFLPVVGHDGNREKDPKSKRTRRALGDSHGGKGDQAPRSGKRGDSM
ncbi:hypothetical protein IAQ61_011309 [Plenodomus lingam]|uniref:Predicted protein n=1 Tax=Leptosphaeria maculans (strain JN3 / isolate v23.1.3 / race Av1-4-5-6-7-8) TaxID=985895 RepID=E5A9N7_LEPMJ|nr:predicted protein [Plenodomus lingam JN3]KAH9859528.1 hypothetical protein IAQ61_011309 [Plenodomus lingam]CBY00378.1 predicted protein [Plenodomus lingam JN3]